MSEAGLGSEGSPQKGVSHSHKTGLSKEQASQVRAMCSNAAECVGSSQTMYCVPTALCVVHCARDISLPVLPADYTQGPLCGFLLGTAFAQLLYKHMCSIAWANTEAACSCHSGGCCPHLLTPKENISGLPP